MVVSPRIRGEGTRGYIHGDGGHGLVIKYHDRPLRSGKRILCRVGDGAVRIVNQGGVLQKQSLDLVMGDNLETRVLTSIIGLEQIGVESLEDVDTLVSDNRWLNVT